jgi:hypothetical protein
MVYVWVCMGERSNCLIASQPDPMFASSSRYRASAQRKGVALVLPGPGHLKLDNMISMQYKMHNALR